NRLDLLVRTSPRRFEAPADWTGLHFLGVPYGFDPTPVGVRNCAGATTTAPPGTTSASSSRWIAAAAPSNARRHANPRPGGMPGYGRGAESARALTSAPRGQF